jgi:hypothetical protein
MLTLACVVLYGSAAYHLSVAMKLDLGGRLLRMRLGAINRVWGAGPHGRAALAALAVLVLLSAQVAAFGVGEAPSYAREPEQHGEWMAMQDLAEASGTTSEGTASEVGLDFQGRWVVEANVSLQWTDDDAQEPPSGPLGRLPQNTPDSFRLTVRLPDGTKTAREASNDPVTRYGDIVLGPFKAFGEEDLATMNVTVECVDAGDVKGPYVTLVADPGNAWSVVVDYTYMVWVVVVEELEGTG